MEKLEDDLMLYALLNGGVPYLIREGAYPHVDGAWDEERLRNVQEDISRCKAVCSLNSKVALEPMTEHHFLSSDYPVEETIFGNSIRVQVDHRENSWRVIEE